MTTISLRGAKSQYGRSDSKPASALAGRNRKMNWRLKNACSSAVRNFDVPMATVVKVTLMAEALDRFCIGLSLVRENLIDSFDLVDARGASSIRLRRSVEATVIEIRHDKINLGLDTTELERWLYFTLRAVRDGTAEVDHLDVEAKDQAHQRVDVIVAYPNSAPAVSSDEDRRRLGL